MITQQHAVLFIQALTQAQPYIPPILFNTLGTCDVVQTLVKIANGGAPEEIKETAGQ